MKSNKINVLFIEPGFGYGGSTMFLLYTLKALNKEKFNPHILFYYRAYGPDIKKFFTYGFKPISLNYDVTKRRDFWGRQKKQKHPLICKFNNYTSFFIDLTKYDIPMALSIAKYIKNKNIKVIVFNNDIHFHIPGLLASIFTRTPCICRKAGIGGGGKISKILAIFVDKFIASSKATMHDYLSNGLPPKKITLIYEGVDIDAFSKSQKNIDVIKKELGIPKEITVLTSISRISPGKGHLELLEALSLVKKETPNFCLLIVGDDFLNKTFVKKVKNKVNELNLQKNVIFTGWCSDIAKILAITDIFIHCPTTWREAMGIANLEAMAMGKPTIVSDNEGLVEAVVNEVTGIIVPPGNIQALAQAILKLIKDKTLANTLGKNAYKRAKDIFNIKKNIKPLEEIILTLANEK